MGYSHGVVSMYESGQCRPSRRLMDKAVEVLELSPEEVAELRALRKLPFTRLVRRDLTWRGINV